MASSKFRFTRRLLPLLAGVPLLLGATNAARAASLTLGSGSDGGRFSRAPYSLTLDTRLGYDDNTLDEPDSFRYVDRNGQVRTRHPSDSLFLNADLSFAYSARNSRSSLTIGATTGITYYFDRPGREYDPNLGLNVSFVYKLTPRATLELTSFNVFQAEPDFGVVGVQERRNGDYFYTSNRFALAYRWAPRFSTVTSYDPSFFVYRQEPYSTFQNRAEHFFSQEFRFLLKPTLTLIGEYRFGYVDYFNDQDSSVLLSVNNAGVGNYLLNPGFHNNSYSHFLLAGIEYAFGPRFVLGLRAGVEFRTFEEDQVAAGLTYTTFNPLVAPPRIVYNSRGHETSPYVEGSLTYALSRRANLALTTRYGIEQGDLQAGDSTRDSFRLGLQYNQGITARISTYLGFYYTHSQYNNAGAADNFSENVYDIALGARFAINRHFAVEAGYTHTTVDSDFSSGRDLLGNTNGRDYDRNRYFVGARFAF